MASLKLCARTHRPKRRDACGDRVDCSYDFSKRRSLIALLKQKTQTEFAWVFFIHLGKILVRHPARTRLATLRNVLQRRDL
jgi:hypothetical protein